MSGTWVSPPLPEGRTLEPLPWERQRPFDAPALGPKDLTPPERAVMRRVEQALQATRHGDFLRQLWSPKIRHTLHGAASRFPIGLHVGNRVGHVQGGLLLNAALATAIAAVPHHPVLTAASAWYISPGQGKALTARSTVLQKGRNVAVVRTEVFAPGGKRVLARPLTMERLRNRITRYHAPYHDALWRTLTELRDRHGHAILLDGHSMPAFSGGEIGQGRRHADIVPGCLGGTSCAPALLQAACEYFTSRGYTVAVDDPYRGGFITRHYGRPREGLHALQLEVNRDLYLDPFTLDHRVRGFARLQTDLLGFVRHLTGLRL